MSNQAEVSFRLATIQHILSSDFRVASSVFDELNRAIRSRRPVAIDYLDSKGNITSRVIEPFRITHGKLGLNVYAWCRDRDAVRAFNVDLIQAAKVLQETYEPRHQYPFEPMASRTKVADQVYDILVQAMKMRRTVTFDYVDRKGQRTFRREVEPYETRVERGWHFIYAFDYSRNEIRKFDLSQINNMQMTRRTFVPKWPIQIY